MCVYRENSKIMARITIPYAVADFIDLRERGFYYVDKTDYIPKIGCKPYTNGTSEFSGVPCMIKGCVFKKEEMQWLLPLQI